MRLRLARNTTVKKLFIVLYLLFAITVTGASFSVQAQEVQTNPPGTATQAQSTQSPLPEIPPTPRSKLEIIQYILLPFAIGASIWLILRLEKMEREEAKENKGK
jgi:hypothetical protein